MTAILLFRQLGTNQSVDGRDKPGHDDVELARRMATAGSHSRWTV